MGSSDQAQTVWQRLTDLRDGIPLTEYLSDHLAGLLALLRGDQAGAAAALERAVGLEGALPVAWVGGSARLLLERGHTDEARRTAASVLKGWEEAGTPGCVMIDGPAVAPVVQLAGGLGRSAAAGAEGPRRPRSRRKPQRG